MRTLALFLMRSGDAKADPAGLRNMMALRIRRRERSATGGLPLMEDPVLPLGCLFGWPGGSLKQCLVALGTFAVLAAFYFLFSALGW